MAHPTDTQVQDVMAAIVAPEGQQPRSVLVEFQRAELERTIRLAWPHIATQIVQGTSSASRR